MENIKNIPQPESVEDKLKKLKERKSILLHKDILGFHDKLTKHIDEVKKAYEEQNRDVREYKAYHMLIGSTTDDKRSPYYDFPEEDFSIENFITKQEEKK